MPKRWQPGHYLQAFDQSSRTTLVQGERALVSGNPNFKGYQIAIWWDQIEPSFGVYDFTDVLAALDDARDDGKYCWIRLIDRSFQGFTFGRPFPTYLDNAPYGWFVDSRAGAQNMVAPKLWESATGERWLLAWEALITACDSHPACQGFTTEEYEMQGSFAQSTWNLTAMDNFWREAARRGNIKAANSLIHINTGWAQSRSAAQLKPLTDYFVSQCCGLGPTDLLRTYIGSGAPQPTLSTDFGKYIFEAPSTGHRDETYFKLSYEWGSFDGTDTPLQLIDWAHDTLRCHFITWDPDRTSASATGNSWSTVLAAINTRSGLIYDLKPSNVAALDESGGNPITPQPSLPAVGNWFPKLVSGANNWTTHAATVGVIAWSTTSVPLGKVGGAYSATLLATGTGTITYTVQTGTLPSGLSLNGATGIISGTPASASTTALTFRASNGTDSADFSTTLQVMLSPTVTTTTLASGTRGSAYSATLAATGTAPIAWRVVAGQLPLGLSIDESTGVIAGTPLRAETMNFVVEGRNAVGADEQSLQIEIENAEVPGDPNPPTDSQWRRAPRDAEVWRRIERDT